jgi:RNA polymerase sigma-70 factor, ECF subfamily
MHSRLPPEVIADTASTTLPGGRCAKNPPQRTSIVAIPAVCTPTTDSAAALRSDGSLLRRYQEGEEAAATALYERYAARLRSLARDYCVPPFAGRFDADDVVQSVFRAFFQGARRQTYTVPPSGELWGLLMVLALNKIRNLVSHHRAGKRAVQQTTALSDIESHLALASNDEAAGFLRMVLDEYLAGLPESNRCIIRLRIEGYAVAEIAVRTCRSRRTVERVLQEFRARLRRA